MQISIAYLTVKEFGANQVVNSLLDSYLVDLMIYNKL